MVLNMSFSLSINEFHNGPLMAVNSPMIMCPAMHVFNIKSNIIFISVMDPKLFFRTGSGFNLNSGSGSGLFMKNTFVPYFRSTDYLNIAKQLIFQNLYTFGSGLLTKNTYELHTI
jgi:hypothetical protein